jgi:uncharacterized short protein YbdD (DUF466 family)
MFYFFNFSNARKLSNQNLQNTSEVLEPHQLSLCEKTVKPKLTKHKRSLRTTSIFSMRENFPTKTYKTQAKFSNRFNFLNARKLSNQNLQNTSEVFYPFQLFQCKKTVQIKLSKHRRSFRTVSTFSMREKFPTKTYKTQAKFSNRFNFFNARKLSNQNLQNISEIFEPLKLFQCKKTV